MSSKVEKLLRDNREAGKGSLIAYFPVGYPSVEDSIEAVVAIGESGADVIELGVPYSDPVMDGLVIQDATQQALSNGFKLKELFPALKAITSRIETPVLVMSYWNPILQYGVERFARDLKAAGGAGIITPDLIPDEAADWVQLAEELDLDRVFLSSPTSSPERVDSACEASRGFVYAVSTMGITGARGEVDQNARKVVSAIRNSDSEKLTAVGIGISTPEQVKDVNSYADGAIVGSAIVKAYASEGIGGLSKLVTDLAAATRN